jgi:hypothetical protein
VGILEPLEPSRYWALRDGTVRVLILPVETLATRDVDSLVGLRVQIRGIVRALRPKQYIRGVDVDLIDHPTLPALPAPSTAYPRLSITAFEFEEKNQRESERPVVAAGAVIQDILESPEAYLQKKVQLRGLFRGANLFADLPPSSRRSRADWVLKDGAHAVWVTGKPPRGKGWSLDPAYKGDAIRWVVVEGKAEVANGVVYLRASKVALSSAPAAEAADADPP